jgi:hypothetical protein
MIIHYLSADPGINIERIVQHVVTCIGPGRGAVPRALAPDQALVHVAVALRPLLEASHA